MIMHIDDHGILQNKSKDYHGRGKIACLRCLGSVFIPPTCLRVVGSIFKLFDDNY